MARRYQQPSCGYPKEGGKLLEIQLLDHLIITTEGYYSFADEGLL